MSPGEVYDIHDKHYLSVDCVIFGYENEDLKVLLYPRGFAPSIGQWSLLGGFVRNSETLGDAARRILLNITGLENIYQEQVHAFSRLDRDPAGRVISVAYFALIRISQHNKDLVREHGAHWWPISKLPKLVFDHKEMIEQSLTNLQHKASFELLGNELLDETFTLTQLKKLYEAIFRVELDSSNFRKKIHSLNVLQQTAIKDKTDSKRGSYLFKFKEKKETVMAPLKMEPIIRV